MPQVGSNNEPLAENANFVYTGSLWVPQKSDASGNTVVTPISGFTSEANNHGYIASAWQKDPLRFGYSNVVSEQVSDTSLPAGSSTLTTTAVPEGEIHIVTQIGFLFIGTSPTWVQIAMDINSVAVAIMRQLTPTSQQVYDRQGKWVLKEDDQIRCVIVGATLNDDLYFYHSGYKIDIDL